MTSFGHWEHCNQPWHNIQLNIMLRFGLGQGLGLGLELDQNLKPLRSVSNQPVQCSGSSWRFWGAVSRSCRVGMKELSVGCTGIADMREWACDHRHSARSAWAPGSPARPLGLAQTPARASSSLAPLHSWSFGETPPAPVGRHRMSDTPPRFWRRGRGGGSGCGLVVAWRSVGLCIGRCNGCRMTAGRHDAEEWDARYEWSWSAQCRGRPVPVRADGLRPRKKRKRTRRMRKASVGDVSGSGVEECPEMTDRCLAACSPSPDPPCAVLCLAGKPGSPVGTINKWINYTTPNVR